jgi:hypothetical protein
MVGRNPHLIKGIHMSKIEKCKEILHSFVEKVINASDGLLFISQDGIHEYTDRVTVYLYDTPTITKYTHALSISLSCYIKDMGNIEILLNYKPILKDDTLTKFTNSFCGITGQDSIFMDAESRFTLSVEMNPIDIMYRITSNIVEAIPNSFTTAYNSKNV